MISGLPDRGKTKYVHTCSYCPDLNKVHLINPDNYANDIYAREDPPNSGKWRCGDCCERITQDSLIRNAKNSNRGRDLIQQRIEEVKEKADITGYINAIKNNERKNFSHLFKNPGLRKRGKK